ncbi:potassium channel family protein [Streptococcus cuniculi]|uniref:Two pore domain potassium channel family protein n=1 Tax=Streptococcus cuniculi TaxID=1432788 RepID=A0A4Y9JB43_9STRE|nr:potassium channel family protein [Streptococcus cuniculi]MBF0778694.1 two pore domain potassium channel family protein [Streptococcus cuniculi]TFU97388.1 two pore domain potassium channel family protein [Streptococcus cuniculi]
MQNKKQIHRLRIIWQLLRVTGFATFLTSFFSFIFLSAGLLLWLEPGFTNYGDSLWYSFVTATTVGYGDLLVTTTLGRIISIILAIYGILFLGSLSGLVVSYYTEVSKHYSLAVKTDKKKTDS